MVVSKSDFLQTADLVEHVSERIILNVGDFLSYIWTPEKLRLPSYQYRYDGLRRGVVSPIVRVHFVNPIRPPENTWMFLRGISPIPKRLAVLGSLLEEDEEALLAHKLTDALSHCGQIISTVDDTESEVYLSKMTGLPLSFDVPGQCCGEKVWARTGNDLKYFGQRARMLARHSVVPLGKDASSNGELLCLVFVHQLDHYLDKYKKLPWEKGFFLKPLISSKEAPGFIATPGDEGRKEEVEALSRAVGGKSKLLLLPYVPHKKLRFGGKEYRTSLELFYYFNRESGRYEYLSGFCVATPAKTPAIEPGILGSFTYKLQIS